MRLPLLVQRDLRAALRKKTAGLRLWAAVVGVCGTLFFLFVQGGPSATRSQSLFQLLFLLSCVKAVFETLHFSLDLIARERRSGTLGLLMLTGLGSVEILLSKLTGVLVIQLSSGLALLPCFAVCFVLGGVPASAFLATALLIPIWTFLTLAISLTSSTFARDEDEAMVVAGGIGAVLMLTGPLVYYLSSWSSTPPSVGWLLSSPVYGIKLTWDFFNTGTFGEFLKNAMITAGYALGFIAAAGWHLQRTWRDDGSRHIRRRRWVGLKQRLQRFGVKANSSPGPVLSTNPYLWLALRDRQSVRLAWGGMAVGAILWGIAFTVSPSFWAATLTTVLVALAAYAGIGMAAMFSAAKRMAEDRRTGALELLLTTSLSVDEIIEGQSQALWMQFGPLLRAMTALTAVLMVAAISVRSWDTIAFTVFLECWATLGCLVAVAIRNSSLGLVMWAALNSGRPLFVIRKVIFPPMSVIAIGYFVYTVATHGWARKFPQGDLPEFWLMTGIFIAAASLAWLAKFSGDGHHTPRLRKWFRLIAQQPLPDPADPRFGKWDPAKPFPEPRRLF